MTVVDHALLAVHGLQTCMLIEKIRDLCLDRLGTQRTAPRARYPLVEEFRRQAPPTVCRFPIPAVTTSAIALRRYILVPRIHLHMTYCTALQHRNVFAAFDRLSMPLRQRIWPYGGQIGISVRKADAAGSLVIREAR